MTKELDVFDALRAMYEGKSLCWEGIRIYRKDLLIYNDATGIGINETKFIPRYYNDKFTLTEASEKCEGNYDKETGIVTFPDKETGRCGKCEKCGAPLKPTIYENTFVVCPCQPPPAKGESITDEVIADIQEKIMQWIKREVEKWNLRD